ncbi:beta-glucosidase precursor [Penicillium sp. IBT 31633x]|nr:beta-glucosidase precursor [Penicillium sp. IBT 31633x]
MEISNSNLRSPPTTNVACLNCREKHLKCDGNLNGCGRCDALSLSCHFVPSRRGLAARRGQQQNKFPYDPQGLECANPQLDFAFTSADVDMSSPTAPNCNHLIRLYYLHFHQAHPFLPPYQLWTLSNPPTYLVEIVEFTSLHYLPSSPVSDRSVELRTATETAELSIEKAQAFLLLSIILHARCKPIEARECIGQAIQCGLDLGFDNPESCNVTEIYTPFHAESVRRTWWEIYIIDTLLATVQSGGILQFPISTPNVALPNEDDVYFGACPSMIRVSDLGHRNPLSDRTNFSSLVYRAEAAIILRQCFIASETHIPQESVDILDATISIWFHRFPKFKQAILSTSGEVNEIDFQATMFMHCASIYLHFSKSLLLPLLPTTSHIICSRPSDFSSPAANPKTHTAKTVSAAADLSKLASLSISVMDHSPFFACIMVLSCVIQMAIISNQTPYQSVKHRSFLALNIQTIKSMGDIWTIAENAVPRLHAVAIELERALNEQSMDLFNDQWALV